MKPGGWSRDQWEEFSPMGEKRRRDMDTVRRAKEDSDAAKPMTVEELCRLERKLDEAVHWYLNHEPEGEEGECFKHYSSLRRAIRELIRSKESNTEKVS